jgi:hypothetical protein
MSINTSTPLSRSIWIGARNSAVVLVMHARVLKEFSSSDSRQEI